MDLNELLQSVREDDRKEQLRKNRQSQYRQDTVSDYAINEGKSELFNLELDTLYIVSGVYDRQSETSKEHVSRLTLDDVNVYPYDLNTRVEELPVLATATHIHTIRKKENLDKAGLVKGKTVWFIGKVYEYQTNTGQQGINRRTLKVFRDPRLDRELCKVVGRIRNHITELYLLGKEGISQQLPKTTKMLARVKTHIQQERFIIPHVTLDQMNTIIQRCEVLLSGLQYSTQ